MSIRKEAQSRVGIKASILALLFACAIATAGEPAADKPAATKPTEGQSEELQSVVRDLEAAIRKAAKSEPSLCYRLAGGDGMTVGQAIELCGGTTDALKTLACFQEAWGHPDEGGLGLNLGQAVDLCKSNARN